jgi:hypothetical protein
MDGLIRTAWRAFWVGLGASAVLIAQSVVAPAAPAPGAVPADPVVAPLLVSPSPVPRAQNTPAASRNPLSVHCASIANVLRCS